MFYVISIPAVDLDCHRYKKLIHFQNYGSSHIATELFVYIPDLADTGNPRHAVYEVYINNR